MKAAAQRERVVILPAAVAQALRRHLQACYPDEGCGLLEGVWQDDVCTITAFHPAANVHPTPRRHFELDPAAHFALLRRLRAQENAAPGQAGRVGQGGASRLIGHVHSHPDGPARPSATDLAMAHDPALIWLIAATQINATQTPLTAWAVEQQKGAPIGFTPLILQEEP